MESVNTSRAAQLNSFYTVCEMTLLTAEWILPVYVDRVESAGLFPA